MVLAGVVVVVVVAGVLVLVVVVVQVRTAITEATLLSVCTSLWLHRVIGQLRSDFQV